MSRFLCLKLVGTAAVALGLAACGGGGGGGGPPQPPATYTVGGAVTGTTDPVTLRLNGANDISVAGGFTFSAALASGTAYTVAIASQPATHNCSISNASGTIASANVSNVVVACAVKTYAIGGTLSGLSGTVVLRNNGGDNLTLSANGPFTFAAPVSHGVGYNVTVGTQPAGQVCTVTSGSAVATANVTNVAVTCASNPSNARTIGGTLSGLSGTVVLRNNGGNDLSLSANGSFTFSATVANGAAYNVTVATQPATQTCTVANSAGTANANVTNVAVTCTNNPSNARTIGGTVSGLIGTVVLQNNGGDNLTTSANGAFTFTNTVANGGTYNVTVATQPTGQECTVTNGSGTATANLTTVAVACVNVFPRYIGGTISGLVGTIVLRNNGGNDLTMTYNVTFNGAFEFSAPIPHGTTYDVTVFAQPATKDCTVTNGSGTATARVTNIVVTCTNATRTLGGTVTGLTGTVVLRNKGGDSLSLSANGAFTFNTPVAKGSAYNVTVETHPAGQTCAVANRSGTASANVTSVAVSCAARTYSLSTRGIKLWMSSNPAALFNEYVGLPPDLQHFELWHDVLAEARAAGATEVTFQLSTGVMVNYDDNNYSSTISYNPPQQALLALAQDARSQGLAVTVSFFSHVQNVISGSGCCNDRPNPADFPTWFSNHRIRVLEAARLARALDARAMIFMSDETQHLMRDPAYAAQWVQLIRDVRAEFPGGLITSTWWTPGHGDSISAVPASIIAELDYLGIGLFPDLVVAEEPDVPTLCHAYRQDSNGNNVIAFLEDLHTAYGKRIWITDKAFHSFKGAAYDEWRVFDPSIPLSPDESMQARLYESFFGVFYTEGPAWLEGVSLQNFNNLRDGANPWIARFVDGPVSESPQHKLAETVISDWFNGRRSTGC